VLSITATSFRLVFQAPNSTLSIIEYEVEDNGADIHKAEEPTVELHGLAPGSAHAVRMRCRSNAGWSKWSESVYITTIANAPFPHHHQPAQPAKPPNASAAGPGRLAGDVETSIAIIPMNKWDELVPTRSCKEELLTNPGVRISVTGIDSIVCDVEMKVMELKFADPPLPVALDDDQMFGLVGYTHDLQQAAGKKEGNLSFELNQQLRLRGLEQRKGMMDVWGVYVHYTLKGLRQLPDFEGDVFRGYPDKTTASAQYKKGRPIQWGAFTSTTTDFEAAKVFCGGKESGAIFKICVSSGKDINSYSFFPSEGEILLSPNRRFFVVSEPYEVDGFTFIDMMQQTGDAWVS
jgi:hypothetical protein